MEYDEIKHIAVRKTSYLNNVDVLAYLAQVLITLIWILHKNDIIDHWDVRDILHEND